MLAENPNDFYSLFQLSSSYSMYKDFEEAVRYGSMALEIMRKEGLEDEFFHTVYHTVTHGLMVLGRSAEAAELGREALKRYPNHLDICYLLSQIYFRAREAEACRDAVTAILPFTTVCLPTPPLWGTTISTASVGNTRYFSL